MGPTFLPAITLLTARLLVSTFTGSLLAIFSSSMGTLMRRNSSRWRKPPPTRTRVRPLLTEDLAALHLDEDSLGAELVHTVSLSDEEGGQLVGVGGGVDVLREGSVEVVVSHCHVGGAAALELEHQLLEVDDVLGLGLGLRRPSRRLRF